MNILERVRFALTPKGNVEPIVHEIPERSPDADKVHVQVTDAIATAMQKGRLVSMQIDRVLNQ